ncbi:hypothetical protein SHKM778_13320 [Streptomyces sp. KM77-8]|uniref:Uncharacterized protein n=1 Tax=Streptomyces haneummycinicus TaxID=3074435 RepID=A0AAT9HC35_9ACTN
MGPWSRRGAAGRCGDGAAGAAGGVLGLVRRFVGAAGGVLHRVEVTGLGGPPGVLGGLGGVVDDPAEPAERADLLGDLRLAVAGDEEGADVPDDGGDGTGLVAAVPLVHDVVADERVEQDRAAGAEEVPPQSRIAPR